MSFQTYLNNIQALTGKTPDAIKQDAIKSKILITGLTATEWITWLAKTYQLGRGHSMRFGNTLLRKNGLNRRIPCSNQ